ncbi:MAG TPA: hypothetical protein PLV68_10155, partial [Ilumatobacteraceae bacterium]|nr:hypothetical protein [Ilumatobacteraceae bacterium]
MTARDQAVFDRDLYRRLRATCTATIPRLLDATSTVAVDDHAPVTAAELAPLAPTAAVARDAAAISGVDG